MASLNVRNDSNNNNGPNQDGGKLIKVYLDQLAEYFYGTVRPLREGENLFDAGWVHSIGTTDSDLDKITGFVYQTSRMNERPHEVKLSDLSSKTADWKCFCSCKAGIGEKCKHIAACLISIQRNPYLYPLSCTDLKQKWGKIGKELTSSYSGVRIQNMCHVLEKVNKHEEEVTEDMKKKIFELTLKAAPDSELARVKKCYRSLPRKPNPTSEESSHPLDEFYELAFTEGSYVISFVEGLNAFLKNGSKEKEMYDKKIRKSKEEAISICMSTTSQALSSQWMHERKLRITGSISYALFTYAKNKAMNWKKKIADTYSNSVKGNQATRYGQLSEKKAKLAYGGLYSLFDSGIYISPVLSYLACSPDGFSYNDDEWKLVEIKSPVNGKFKSADDLLVELPYLERLRSDDAVKYQLKKKHKYFGQIQLSLFICSLQNCDLVIYSSFTDSIEIINVPIDYEFVEIYIPALTEVYFNHIFPNLMMQEFLN